MSKRASGKTCSPRGCWFEGSQAITYDSQTNQRTDTLVTRGRENQRESHRPGMWVQDSHDLIKRHPPTSPQNARNHVNKTRRQDPHKISHERQRGQEKDRVCRSTPRRPRGYRLFVLSTRSKTPLICPSYDTETPNDSRKTKIAENPIYPCVREKSS